MIGVHLPLCQDGVYVPAHHRGRGNVGLYRTGILFEEPNPNGSRPRDPIGPRKETNETPPRSCGGVTLKIPQGDRNGVSEDGVC